MTIYYKKNIDHPNRDPLLPDEYPLEVIEVPKGDPRAEGWIEISAENYEILVKSFQADRQRYKEDMDAQYRLDGYAAFRSIEYPNMGDQFDRLFKFLKANDAVLEMLGFDMTEVRAYITEVQNIKKKYPKPGA